ncbi:MAG: adenylosuccinate synthase [Candidatus Eisenbacteria bacterium RBG_19FT_COMBO_70_11]|nr:MAG: adenylosuccinate synthase [Candidatus Eisenbacteria bacterium RBG_19FT_COMBO_70_11]
MPCTVVVGAQWGDEGKGKVVDALSGQAEVVARYQGGPNAGHSVIHQGRTVVLHLVPSGVMHPGRRCLIGNGVVVDLPRLREEVGRLEALGVEVVGRLGVSPAAHLILPYHRAAEAAAERGPDAIGTTGRGIGFAYRDKAARTGIRIGDLVDRDAFVAAADRNLARLRREFPEADLGPMSGAGLAAELADTAAWLEPMVCDVSAELHRALRDGRRVLLEGAQGTLLDLDHGTYPFVTSSAASAAGAPLGVGLGPRAVDRVIGVTKAYATRVGNGPFPSEMPEAEAARLREAGEEYGDTTGRPRRCGWLDLTALRYAARVNGLDHLIVTKLDVLDAFDRIQVAVRYEVDGRPVEDFPASAPALARCRPVYREFPGWKESTTSARRWTDLPARARDYLEWIERETGVPIAAVSVGAAREAEVRRA